jgi:argininosuccinate lyase
MPQKKNPDVAELIRGKSGKVFGNLMGLLTMLKGLPLAYNKDMQEDKQYMFETVEVIKDSLEIFSEMIYTAHFNEEKMKAACEKGYLNATDIADYLVNKGLEFRKSHEVVGSIVKYLETHGMTFKELSLASYKAFSELFDEDIYDVLKLDNAIAMKKSKGSTSLNSIKEMITIGNQWLEEVKK